jgi:hypothetical protein
LNLIRYNNDKGYGKRKIGDNGWVLEGVIGLENKVNCKESGIIIK